MLIMNLEKSMHVSFCVFQGSVSGSEGDRWAETGVVHQILLLLSTRTHTQTHKHTHSSHNYIYSYTVHCFLYTSLCFPHTHTQTNRCMGSSPARPSQTLPQSSTKKCFSNTCLTSSLEHRPAGSCLHRLKCLHMLFFIKAVFLFFKRKPLLRSPPRDVFLENLRFLKISTRGCLSTGLEAFDAFNQDPRQNGHSPPTVPK